MTLYVQKIRVPVRVSQPNLGPRDGCFLLSPQAEHGDRAETLLALLNSTRVVIPFILEQRSDVLLLTRVNIDWVVVGKGVDPGLVYPPGHVVTNEQQVDLRLIDETHVYAAIQWNSPNGNVRLSDYLNGSEEFIAARSDFGTLVVNKLHVREMYVAESAARGFAPTDLGARVGPNSAHGDRERPSA